MKSVLRAIMPAVLILPVLFSCRGLSWAASDVTFSDANFVNSFRDASGRYRAYDFNRFRSKISLKNPSDKLHLNAILDFESYISRPFIKSAAYQILKDPDPDLPFNPYWDAFESDDALGRFYLYRLNAEARFEDSRLVLGIQRIPFGVGRMWNPTDTFNPINALSVEPEERLGVFAADYTRYLSEFSSLQLISNVKKKGALDKYGFRYKGHYAGMDMGISFIRNADFLMSGVEWASNLLQTGIEARSELSFFNNDNLNKTYFSGVAGLEYAFSNNVTILGEYFYNGLGSRADEDYDTGVLINGNWNLGRHYLGMTVTYDMNPLTTLSLSAIYNVGDQSLFAGPSLSYSINDETTVGMGAHLFAGDDTSEFGYYYDNLYYLKFETYF